MKSKFVRVSVLVPVTIGIVFGSMLFALGYTQDAPGMCVIGLGFAFGLVMLGVRNIGIIKKGFLAPLLFFCYASGGTILDFRLLFNNEFKDDLGLFFIILGIVAILFAIGGILFWKYKKS